VRRHRLTMSTRLTHRLAASSSRSSTSSASEKSAERPPSPDKSEKSYSEKSDKSCDILASHRRIPANQFSALCSLPFLLPDFSCSGSQVGMRRMTSTTSLRGSRNFDPYTVSQALSAEMEAEGYKNLKVRFCSLHSTIVYCHVSVAVLLMHMYLVHVPKLSLLHCRWQRTSQSAKWWRKRYSRRSTRTCRYGAFLYRPCTIFTLVEPRDSGTGKRSCGWNTQRGTAFCMHTSNVTH
jgi:hypothetical protein